MLPEAAARSTYMFGFVLSLSLPLSLNLSLSLEAAVLTCFVQGNACSSGSGWVPCTCRGPLHVECMCRVHPYALKFELCPCMRSLACRLHATCATNFACPMFEELGSCLVE